MRNEKTLPRALEPWGWREIYRSNTKEPQITWVFMDLKGWCRSCSGFRPLKRELLWVYNSCESWAEKDSWSRWKPLEILGNVDRFKHEDDWTFVESRNILSKKKSSRLNCLCIFYFLMKVLCLQLRRISSAVDSFHHRRCKLPSSL